MLKRGSVTRASSCACITAISVAAPRSNALRVTNNALSRAAQHHRRNKHRGEYLNRAPARIYAACARARPHAPHLTPLRALHRVARLRARRLYASLSHSLYRARSSRARTRTPRIIRTARIARALRIARNK